MKYIFLHCILPVLIGVNAMAQISGSVKDSAVVTVTSQAHYGFIIPHTEDISALAKSSRPWGFQVDVSRLRYTKGAWDACNCYSQNGLSISYFNFDNPDTLGGSVNLVLFAEPQLVYGKIGLRFRAGMGLSYVNRIYDREENPRNLFVSNHLSGILLVQLAGTIAITPQLRLRLASSFHHISNGGMRQPNKGVNFPTVSMGADYALNPSAVIPRRKNILRDKSLHYYAGLSYNTRSIDSAGITQENREPVVGLQAGVYKPVSPTHALGIAIEASYDGSLKRQAQINGESFDHRIVSGLVRHHFLFGKFDFSQALGFYLYKNYSTPHSLFQRYAIDYGIFKNFRLGFSLKAHLHVAEQMDLRFLVVL